MSKKIHPAKKCKTQAVSLPPPIKRYAQKRSFSAGLTISRYFQLLTILDRRKNLLPEAILLKLKSN